MADSADRDLVARVKEVHRGVATGVTIVTVAVDGRPYGLAVNAFSSVSLEPPAVLACVAKSSLTHRHLVECQHVGINVLAHDQTEVALAFARSGGDKFVDLDWYEGSFGVPLIAGSAGHLEVEIDQRLDAYTHTIFVGRVLKAAAHARPPLLYVNGNLIDSAEIGLEAEPHG